jgi:hypothetical protein
MLSSRIFSFNKYAAIQAFYGSLPTQGVVSGNAGNDRS